MSKESLTPEFVFNIFSRIFSEDVRFRSVMFLCKHRNASIREIAKHLGISHKNLSMHLNYLASKGIIEVTYSRPNLRLYRLSDRLSIIEKLSKQA